MSRSSDGWYLLHSQAWCTRLRPNQPAAGGPEHQALKPRKSQGRVLKLRDELRTEHHRSARQAHADASLTAAPDVEFILQALITNGIRELVKIRRAGARGLMAASIFP